MKTLNEIMLSTVASVVIRERSGQITSINQDVDKIIIHVNGIEDKIGLVKTYTYDIATAELSVSKWSDASVYNSTSSIIVTEENREVMADRLFHAFIDIAKNNNFTDIKNAIELINAVNGFYSKGPEWHNSTPLYNLAKKLVEREKKDGGAYFFELKKFIDRKLDILLDIDNNEKKPPKSLDESV